MTTTMPEHFDPTVHHPTLRKGDRISFPSKGVNGDVTVYGNIAYLTPTGYRVAVPVQGVPEQALWVEVAGDQATPAPFPGKPVFNVLDITYGEALSIYLYAHRQIADVRDVGQAEIVRRHRDPYDDSPELDYAEIVYRTRGADSERRTWEITPSVDEFAFELQQTLARYAAGLVDAEIAAERVAG